MPEKRLEKPDLEIAGLQIWIQGRQYPDSVDYWDGNWLNVSIHCGRERSSVWATGPILHVPDLARFEIELRSFSKSLQGSVELQMMEPNFGINFKSNDQRTKAWDYDVDMTVRITPNLVLEKHEFVFGVNQDHLNTLADQLKAMLGKYPLRGKSEAT